MGLALSTCRRILDLYPRHIQSYALLGQICLRAGEHQRAADLFRRVLSADPEHALAYASMGAIYQERGLLDEATWQYQRAHELSPRNQVIREALQRLYAEFSLQDSQRVTMTRSALARTYLRGRLYGKAIGELRSILEQEPHRLDLRVALAEALWRDGNNSEAEAVCEGILAELPNCLKANLILGQIWLNTERDTQGRQLLQVAQSLDPENTTAQMLFESHSPLPPKMVRLPMTDADMEPLDLPYPLDDDADMASDRTIDGQVHIPAENVPALGLPANLEDRSEPDTVVGSAAIRRSASIPAQRAYLDQHPQDRQARLALARQYSSVGDITHALAEYAHLVQDAQDLPALIAELTTLNALIPGHMGLLNLLVLAQEKSSRSVE